MYRKVLIIPINNINILSSYYKIFDSKKPFKLLLSIIKYTYNGGCSITVSTRGCGPRGEGSTPSFRPFE